MAEEVLAKPARVERFPTGLKHFVFEATSGWGDAVVVRISRREDVGVALDSVYWSDRLRPLGVPLPKLLYADMSMARHPFPFVILERLPGRDLGYVVDRLAHDELCSLARRLADVLAIVTDLPPGRGYGFAPRMDGPFPDDSWKGSVAALLSGSRKRIRDADIVSEHHADRVETVLDSFTTYFAGVQPTPFLHDITTKNVIIDGSRLSGIVDVDDLCFGDPLFLVGLIRMALEGSGNSTVYADAWVDVLRPDDERRAALDFYTALFCLTFMSELGRRFNRAKAEPFEKAYVERLQGILDRYLT